MALVQTGQILQSFFKHQGKEPISYPLQYISSDKGIKSYALSGKSFQDLTIQRRNVLTFP